MKVLGSALAILGLNIAQIILTGLTPSAVRFFDLPLILVIYYALTKGPTGALLAGTLAGLLQDALGATLLGPSALSKALIGYLVGVFGRRFSPTSLLARILIIAAATVLASTMEVGTLAIMGRNLAYSTYPHLLERMLGNSLAGALVMETMRYTRLGWQAGTR